MNTLLAILSLVATSHAVESQPLSIVEQYPYLKDHLYEESATGLHLGVGISPVGFTQSRPVFSASFFQLHYITPRLDVELFNASFAMTVPPEEGMQSRHFIFKSSPKVELFNDFSVGPLAGYEFVSFPDVKVRQTNGKLTTPVESFSSRGWIYGVAASQRFQLGGQQFRVTGSLYKQTYEVSQTTVGQWKYQYDDPKIESDPERELIRGGTVLGLEGSILF